MKHVDHRRRTRRAIASLIGMNSTHLPKQLAHQHAIRLTGDCADTVAMDVCEEIDSDNWPSRGPVCWRRPAEFCRRSGAYGALPLRGASKRTKSIASQLAGGLRTSGSLACGHMPLCGVGAKGMRVDTVSPNGDTFRC